jgi:hypothetical protein
MRLVSAFKVEEELQKDWREERERSSSMPMLKALLRGQE